MPAAAVTVTVALAVGPPPTPGRPGPGVGLTETVPGSDRDRLGPRAVARWHVAVAASVATWKRMSYITGRQAAAAAVTVTVSKSVDSEA